MKKTTLYTLLCTTIMIPSISLATEGEKKDTTQPLGVASTPLKSAIPSRLLASQVVDSPLKTDTPIKDAEREKKEILSQALTMTPLRAQAKKKLQEETELDEHDINALAERKAKFLLLQQNEMQAAQLRAVDEKKEKVITERKLKKEEKRAKQAELEQDIIIAEAQQGFQKQTEGFQLQIQELTQGNDELSQKVELFLKDIEQLKQDKLRLKESHELDKERLQRENEEKIRKTQISTAEALKMLELLENEYAKKIAEIDLAEKAKQKAVLELEEQKRQTKEEAKAKKKYEDAFKSMKDASKTNDSKSATGLTSNTNSSQSGTGDKDTKAPTSGSSSNPQLLEGKDTSIESPKVPDEKQGDSAESANLTTGQTVQTPQPQSTIIPTVGEEEDKPKDVIFRKKKDEKK